jgi:AcrR family transcriptional regulator
MVRRRALPRLEPRKQPVQARSQATYRAILEAAARILEQTGYEALTTNHVAERAGVAIASLYEYFPNKQSLVAEVVRHTLDAILADLRESVGVLVQAGARAPAESVRGWLAAMFDAVRARRRLVGVLMREVAFLWDIPAVERARGQLFELARSSRAARAAALGLRPLPDATIYLLTTMTAAAILEAAIHPPAHLTAEQLIDSLADIVLSVAERAR